MSTKDEFKDVKPITITKKQKKIITAVVCAVAALAAIIAIISVNKTAIYSRLILSFMPDSVVADNGSGTEYFVELSKGVDKKDIEENPLMAFSFYYYDENGKRIDLGPDPVIEENGEDTHLAIAFLLKSVFDGNIPNTDDIKVVVSVVVIIIAAAAGSVVWFIVWSKNEDKEQQLRKQKANKKKKK